MINLPTPPTDNFKQRSWIWATPSVVTVLFILAMSAFLYVLNDQDEIQAKETTVRDVELARQTIRTRLQTTQDRLSRLARDVAQESIDETGFLLRAKEVLADSPELSMIGIMDPERFSRWAVAAPTLFKPMIHPSDSRIDDAESYWAYDAARDSLRPMYSRPFIGQDNEVYVEVHAPILVKGRCQGTVFSSLPVSSLLGVTLPEDFRSRYVVSIIDGGGNTIASNVSRSIDRAKLSYDVPLDPPGQGLRLRAVSFQSSSQVIQNMLAWVVVGLSLLIVWSFGMLWRNSKLRSTAERRLLAETKFRRAMENSVITGMRALDMSGRITYVNPAFCHMTGFAEDQLVGHTPPFPYWPKDAMDEQQRNLDMLLSGQAPASGLEAKIMRRDGSRFDARMYVSPLIDSNGVQSGWMTSITDITEPKRVRQELAAAHQRFTRVLEEIDAAVSVNAKTTDSKGQELLFANRLYREWFVKANSYPTIKELKAHMGAADTVEWQQPETGRWFEIRLRRIPWVDGRLVSMQLATNITDRKAAEENARNQQEKLQFTSRLITMGELASSLAHELNQPLSAIANYNAGSIARIKSGKSSVEDILPALEKATIQAQRAGNVIRRIREFVKRKAPNRKPCDIGQVVDDAVSFADLEARNQQARVQIVMDQDLPIVFADPILIEQVLLNLIKNAMEAMKDVNPTDRLVEISITRDEQNVQISVADRGHGVPEELREKLFESFFSTKSEGMGMGLNICRTIIEYHEGRLWVEPNPDGGSIFKFVLPPATAHNSGQEHHEKQDEEMT